MIGALALIILGLLIWVGHLEQRLSEESTINIIYKYKIEELKRDIEKLSKK